MQKLVSISNFLQGHKVDLFVNNFLELLRSSSFLNKDYKGSSVDFRNLKLTQAGREKVVQPRLQSSSNMDYTLCPHKIRAPIFTWF